MADYKTIKGDIKKLGTKPKETLTKISTSGAKGVNNLKVNYNKTYELAKTNTKMVLNTAGHAFVLVGIVHFAMAIGSPLVLIPGAIIAIKTLVHAKESNQKLAKEKSLIKKTK